MQILYIVRGLPGVGKTTLAKRLTPFNVCADEYLEINQMPWKKELLSIAHTWCEMTTENFMVKSLTPIAVHNTFTRKQEFENYIKLAEQYGYQVIEIIVKSDFNNAHNVPQEKIEEMRSRFEY